MGISGLLPILKSIHNIVDLKNYQGKTLAIDGYCWLHKGAFSCAMDLCLGRPTTKCDRCHNYVTSRYVDFCMNKIFFLQKLGIIPYVVLDGGHLPMKGQEEESRRMKRETNLALGKKYLSEKNMKKAMEFFQICVDIDGEMALELIRRLRRYKIQYVVAPYEADAQLAYLEKEGIVDGIITEDSDLLVFGGKHVFYKLDKDGMATEVKNEDLGSVSDIDLRGWSMKQFRHMCILSGCDYLENLPGIGLKTAHKLMKKYKTVERVISGLKLEKKMIIPTDYMDRFQRAELTFLHQRVFDPRSKLLVHLYPITDDVESEFENLDFLGPLIPDDILFHLVSGEADPNTRQILTIFKDEKPTALQTIQKHFSTKSDKNCVLSTVPIKKIQPPSQLKPKRPLVESGYFSSIFPKQEVKKLRQNVQVDGNLVISGAILPSVRHEEFEDVLSEVDLNHEHKKEAATANQQVPDRFSEIFKRILSRKKQEADVVVIDDDHATDEENLTVPTTFTKRRPLVGLPKYNNAHSKSLAALLNK